MKKLFVILLILVCITSIVSAELELDEVRVYVNNERYSDADEKGGDIEVKKGNTLELMVSLNNNMNTTTQARLKGVIDNIDGGSDITKWQPSESTWYDISADDDKTKSLSFVIPSNAIKDEYDLDLTVYYKYSNETEHSLSKIEWNVIVIEEKQKEITINEAVSNMSIVCNQVINKMSESFDYIRKYSGCAENLTDCREERGTYKTQVEENEKTKNECVIARDSYKDDVKECEDNQAQMISKVQCNNEKETDTTLAVKEAEKKKDTMMMGIVLVAAAIGVVVWKKRKGVSIHDKYYKQKRMP